MQPLLSTEFSEAATRASEATGNVFTITNLTFDHA